MKKYRKPIIKVEKIESTELLANSIEYGGTISPGTTVPGESKGAIDDWDEDE